MESKNRMNRRRFLTTLAAASVAADSPASTLPQSSASKSSSTGTPHAAAGHHPALAIHGGKPVRKTKLTTGCGIGTEYYDEQERGRLEDVLTSHNPFRWYGPGGKEPTQCASFEREFAQRMQCRYALGVTSGTAALQCAMAALGVGPGDEVILPAWTWYACYNAIVLAGALPVFAEIDESLNIDPDDVEQRITPDTKAIMAVHLEGCPCDMDRILSIARKHGIKVLEDCAQSLGASYKGKPLGSMGDIAIYSFQLCKTVTSGEGGCVVTNDSVLFERASRFHDLGQLRPQLEKQLDGAKIAAFAGANFRMSEFTGAVLVAQLRKLNTVVGALRANGRRVYEGIRELPNVRFRRLPDPDGELAQRVYLQFPSKQLRDRYIAAMNAENVPATPPEGSVILPIDRMVENKVTVHPAWPSFTTPRGRAISYGAEACSQTIEIFNRFAGVSLDPKFTEQDTQDISAAINKVYPVIINA